MFLNLTRRFRRVRGDDGGVLISVIGLLALVTIIALVIGSSTANALTNTTSTRAGVQSQAAADAGLAVAQSAMLQTGVCESNSGIFQNWPGVSGYVSTNPQYRAKVWTQVGGAWVQSCPTSTSTQMRIISQGAATSGGAGKKTANNNRYMEALYTRTITVDNGSALTFGNGAQFDSNNVVSGTGLSASLQLISGNYSCTNAGTIDASIYVPSGTVNITNHCYIKGSIYSSGKVTMDSYGHVGGDVTSQGGVDMENNTQVDGSISTDGDVLVNNSGLVKGSVQSRGTGGVTGSGRVNGNLTARYINTISGRIDGSVISTSYSADSSVSTTVNPGSSSDLRVGGSLTLGGTVSTWSNVCGNYTEAGYKCGLTTGSGAVTGTITLHQSGLALPSLVTLPVAKAWTDVPYKKSDWTDVGFSSTVLTWPSGFCNLDNYGTTNSGAPYYTFWQNFKAISTNTIVDMTACSTMNFGSDAAQTFKLRADMLFLVKAFTIQNWVFDSSTTTDIRRLYVLSPDSVASTPTKPDCSTGNISWNGTKMTSMVRGFIYTPCQFYWGAAATVNGQIYAGTYSQANSGETLTYYPVGIPGVDFSNGASATPSTFTLTGVQNRPDAG